MHISTHLLFLYLFADGNCRTPIAGQAKIVNGILEFRGLISKPDGTEMIAVTQKGSPSDAVEIGRLAGLEVKRIAGTKFQEYGDEVIALQQAAAAAKAAKATA